MVYFSYLLLTYCIAFNFKLLIQKGSQFTWKNPGKERKLKIIKKSIKYETNSLLVNDFLVQFNIAAIFLENQEVTHFEYSIRLYFSHYTGVI